MSFCVECGENKDEPCEHLLAELEAKSKKECLKCKTQKKIQEDFYSYKSKKGEVFYKNTCKDCYKLERKSRAEKRDNYHCDICDSSVLLKNKYLHLKTKQHKEKCKTEYDKGYADAKRDTRKKLNTLIKELIKVYKELKE